MSKIHAVMGGYSDQVKASVRDRLLRGATWSDTHISLLDQKARDPTLRIAKDNHCNLRECLGDVARVKCMRTQPVRFGLPSIPPYRY